MRSLVFGPVASRRLGRSLGVNHVPAKTCSYSCVYCQLGPTPSTEHERRAFFAPERVAQTVLTRLAELRARGERVDYVTLVPDGEPTLDAGLGRLLELLRPSTVPIAVMSNGSLCYRADVRAELGLADWVSLKVDAGRVATWRSINRPDPRIAFEQLREGLRRFARAYAGVLVTETMLVAGLNDSEDEVAATVEIVRELAPRIAYLGVPTRPPAQPWVDAPADDVVARAYALMSARLPRVETLADYPEPDVGFAHDLESELCAIAAVHPLRRPEVERLVEKANAHFADVERLIDHGELSRIEYRGQEFYVRPVVPRAPRSLARDAK